MIMKIMLMRFYSTKEAKVSEDDMVRLLICQSMGNINVYHFAVRIHILGTRKAIHHLQEAFGQRGIFRLRDDCHCYGTGRISS
ncbi:hypothetical protein TNCT_341071 [Trichonephila clavata]|uniref:Uncharacterized protein n=1 Tax=Trichonephila clavata TaxID=2740835 RepID=A0A8X6LVV9_TRICU|nr:hypothetical protein TNCT_341071 [Trichonephila clavata]